MFYYRRSSRTLLFLHSINICNNLYLLIPNLQSTPPSPLATTRLFSLSVYFIDQLICVIV